tara:strand:- start:977 stop:1126 length:150 start_codon:yes stop_codon:yes gene_type:complete
MRREAAEPGTDTMSAPYFAVKICKKTKKPPRVRFGLLHVQSYLLAKSEG